MEHIDITIMLIWWILWKITWRRIEITLRDVNVCA